MKILISSNTLGNTILKFNEGISVLKKLRQNLPRKSLATMYKALLRPVID